MHQLQRYYFDSVSNKVNETQYGSINGKGIDDALLILTVITTSALVKGVNLYNCYIGLKKTYDRVSRKIYVDDWVVFATNISDLQDIIDFFYKR